MNDPDQVPTPLAPRDEELDEDELEEEAFPGGRDYRPIGKLGRGGMAKILLVKDPLFDREVAMKVALPDAQDDPALLRRFLNEARITARLDHPAIPPVHDAGIDPGGNRYFTMKRVKGDTLSAVLDGQHDGDPASPEAYTLPRLLDVFLRICEAVAFAHTRGVAAPARSAGPATSTPG